MASCTKQEAMLKKIQEIQFVAIELNLYLDTHPNDEEALCEYNERHMELCKLIEEYECEFGPLFHFGHSMGGEDCWLWIEGPWPWQI